MTNAAAGTPDLGALSEKRTRTVHSILGAAMRIVEEEGIAGLSMSNLALRAGVSRQTLYNYFPDIDAVLAGLVELGDGGTAELGHALSAEPDPRASLQLFVTTVVTSIAAGHPSPVALTAALPTSQREAIAAHRERSEQLLCDVLRRGRDLGVFRTDVDPALDGRILYRAAFAAAELAREPGTNVEALSDRLARDMLAMVDAGGAHDERA